MKKFFLILFVLIILPGLTFCTDAKRDQTGPEIKDIHTSSNVLVISDCPSTSVVISAKVSDTSGVESVLLWYRIAPDQKFTSAPMEFQDGSYAVSLKGADFLGHAYGTINFYISAQDSLGNKSQSEVDQSIQFLPCVSS
jgi:hypothetical protein